MAKRKRARRPARPAASPPEQRPRQISKRERVTVAWSGALFVLIGAAGLQWLPRLGVIWIVFLIFGVATIPQVTIWWVNELKRRR